MQHEVEDPLQRPAMSREIAADKVLAYTVSKQAILQMIALHSFQVQEILDLVRAHKMVCKMNSFFHFINLNIHEKNKCCLLVVIIVKFILAKGLSIIQQQSRLEFNVKFD